SSLFLEHFLALEADPFSAIAQSMNRAIGAPTGLARAVSPSSSGFLDAPKARAVECGCTVFGLGGDQPHFLPLARPFAFARSRFDRLDHRSVGLGNDMLGSHCR